jgi:hypothetical protein
MPAILALSVIFHFRLVHGHHGMARPQVVDEAVGLQICRVAANILNKQSRKAERGEPPVWSLGVCLTTPRRKNTLVMKNKKDPRTWMDCFNQRT